MIEQRITGLKSFLDSDMNTFVSPSWRSAVFLFIVALLAYANSFPGAFILDDLHIVQNNVLVSNPNLITIFRSDYWYGFENSGLYRPLTILSLAVNRMVLGEAVWGFHLVNVLLHAALTVLTYITLLRWGLARGIAFMAAALFAVHPIHADVVNIAVGRSELLVACFLMGGFCLARGEGGASKISVCLCYFAALLSKEHAITFLALLPLWTAFVNGFAPAWRRNWPLYIGLLLTTVCWSALYLYAPVQTMPRSIYSHEASPLAFVTWDVRVLTALLLQWLYLFKQVLPLGLQAVYSTADLPAFITSPWSVSGVLVIAGTLAAVGLVACGWRRRNLLALFAAFYAISFLPTANIFFPVGVTYAERLAYFPSLWFCVWVAVLLGWLSDVRGGKLLGSGLFVGYLLFLAVVCLWRNPDFSSETRLWNAEVVNNPEDYLGWQNLAESLANSRRYAEAERAYRRMSELAPDYPGGVRAWAAFLSGQGRHQEALLVSRRALEIALAREDFTAVAYDRVKLADSLIALGDHQEALSQLDQIDPRMGLTTRLLELRGKALVGLGRYREAAKTIERIVEVGKKSDIRVTYALALINLARLAEARHQLEEDVKGRDSAEGWNLLGVVCALQHDWPSAIAAFERATKRDPDNYRYRENLKRAISEAEEAK